MSATIGKLAPTAAVAAIVAWCCWSYFGETESPAGAQQADSLPEIATRLLSPIVEPASDRNPFKAWEDLNADSARIEQLVAEIAGETAAPSKEEVLKILGNREPGATFIQGRWGMEVIGGRVYEQGEPLAIPGPITEPCWE